MATTESPSRDGHVLETEESRPRPPQGVLGRIRQLPLATWLSRHPQLADAALAVVVTAIGVGSMEQLWHADRSLVEEPDALAYALAVLGGTTLIWRRRAPLVVALANSVFIGLYFSLDYPPGPVGLSNMVAIYTLAAYRPRRLSITVASTLFVVATVGEIATGEELVDILVNFPVFALPWAIGDSVQTHRRYLANLEDRAASLERERAERDRLAVANERARIANELHDVIAHHVGVMVVQAGAARSVLDDRPADARRALLAIEHTGRDALVELRRLVGVLRDDDAAAAARNPQPGVDDLRGLIDTMRDAGLATRLEIEGTPVALSPATELCVYRVVQEALTNTLKHSGSAHASVRLQYDSSALTVEVEDEGRGVAAPNGIEGGHGIVGMRERVALFGGELEVGPKPEGGFAVRATLPLNGAQP
jgi:signal transduction histidine kinase